MRYFWLLIYIYKHLPATDKGSKLFKLIRRIRSSVGKHLFDKCGTNINIEKGADFGKGSAILLGIIRVLA